MKMKYPLIPLLIILPFTHSTLISQTDKEEEETIELSPFTVSSPTAFGYTAGASVSGTRIAGATVGGAQDIRYFRDQVSLGNIPHPNSLTSEGLLSEHDLPLGSAPDCEKLFCVGGEAIPADLAGDENARYLAQLGLTSGLDLNTWKRDPLNLIAVVDKSGSMSGQPLELVRKSLEFAVEQLRPDDRIAIVIFGDSAKVHLAPTPASKENRKHILNMIRAIQSEGSTRMETGLNVAYNLARNSRNDFNGQTRLMLFTDERPNAGVTDPGSFMGMAYAGSKEGFGLTTIGVGVQFDAELATKISNVRGGNLFYFANEKEMQKLFREEFSTIVTELAHDLEILITPTDGLRITGVYGIPGEALEWVDDRAIRMKIATVFLSVRQGGIFFAFGHEQSDLPSAKKKTGNVIGKVDLQYNVIGAEGKERETAEFRLTDMSAAGLGLRRGYLLVSEYLALKKAGIAHYFKNDQEIAFQAVRQTANQFRNWADSSLDKETDLLVKLESTLALLSGHIGEAFIEENLKHLGNKVPRELLGIWKISNTPTDSNLFDNSTIIAFWPAGGVSIFQRHEGHDYHEGDLAYKATGKQSFLLQSTENFNNAPEEISVEYSLRNNVLTLNIEDHGKFRLKADRIRLDPDTDSIDPVFGLPKR